MGAKISFPEYMGLGYGSHFSLIAHIACSPGGHQVKQRATDPSRAPGLVALCESGVAI